jgi:(1->4)-alpha-D-glucan 1-alpha-D-glucosylmutase
MQLRSPLSTYRLQFNKDFRFADATRLLDYLSLLGITDVYASPILASRKGSGHGYDVTDPTRIDPEIGSEQEFETLQSELAKRGMGLLLDIVPNHMAASSENPWWMDVLENGRQSVYASYFDIDWQPPPRNLSGKVLLPILGRPFGETLDHGQLRLSFQGGRFFIRYYESILPVAPESYHQILNRSAGAIEKTLGREHTEFQEFAGILAGLASVSPGVPGSAAEQRPKLDAMRDRLRILASENKAIEESIESSLKDFNGTPGNPASFNLLERLLSQQHYLLAYWQDPNEGINYRRFFAISDLVGLRVEDPIVFTATHDQILRIVAKGAGQGLRIGLRVDHIDGLRDPAGYLTRLQQHLAEALGSEAQRAYIVVEKILARGEELPGDWPISGTTGYEYLNHLNGAFVNPDGCERIERIYSRFTGRKVNFADVVYEKKKLAMNSLLRVEVRGLARQLAEIAASDRYARGISRLDLIEALTEVTACMSVYRTYVRSLDVPQAMKHTIERALEGARARRPQLSELCLDFLRDVLTLANPPHVGPEQREERLAFVMRWQQFTGPIVAKGFEDTALYVYYPLCSLNEVGGDPEPAGVVSREQFYDFARERGQRWPSAINATETHDTKRSEDLRARINVLSEIPEEWDAKIAEWARENAGHKQMMNGFDAPDANEEYLIYQTLVAMVDARDPEGTTKRVQKYIVKALREAKVHTRWIEPSEEYEEAVARFVENILCRKKSGRFLGDLLDFQRRIAWFGMVNALGQALLKIVSPGTPDFYQGSESWDFHLVDPDNRGIVNFAGRCAVLGAISSGGLSEEGAFELFRSWRDGRIKMHVTRTALQYRTDRARLFATGEFLPIGAQGSRRENVISILRRNEHESVLAVVPRWLASACTEEEAMPSRDFWAGTILRLPECAPANWRNLFSGERVETQGTEGTRSIVVHDVLRRFPVALLAPSESNG